MAEAIPPRDAPFEPGRTALLLVDMQKVWLDRAAGAEHGTPEPDPFYATTAEVTIPACARLLAAARAAGVEVLHTILQSLTENGRDRSLDHKMTPIHLAKSDTDAQPIAALAPLGDEIVVPKTSSGVFNSTNIDYVLRNLGVRYLIVAGCLTDQCVDSTVRDACDLGYLVTVPTDACLTLTSERHEWSLRNNRGYCRQRTTAVLVEEINRLGTER